MYFMTVMVERGSFILRHESKPFFFLCNSTGLTLNTNSKPQSHIERKHEVDTYCFTTSAEPRPIDCGGTCSGGLELAV